MAVSCRESLIPCYMFHTEKSEKALAIFLHGTDFIQLNYGIFLLKLRPFKNYSSTFHIIAKHVDIYIFVGDTKCVIFIIVLQNYNYCWVFWNSVTNQQTMYYIDCFVGT